MRAYEAFVLLCVVLSVHEILILVLMIVGVLALVVQDQLEIRKLKTSAHRREVYHNQNFTGLLYNYRRVLQKLEELDEDDWKKQ